MNRIVPPQRSLSLVPSSSESIATVPLFRWAEFVLPSTLQLAPLMELLIEPIGCLVTCQRIELGLHEALVNAVRHGNGENPSKRLRIRRILTPYWLVWQIQDEGHGLPRSARQASLPDQLEAASGRGLYLIHQCFDDVRWSRRGNRLQLACRRPVSDGGSQDPSTHL